MLETGHISELSEIFVHIPKSIVAADLGVNNNRMNKLIDRPELFSIEELARIAYLIDVNAKVIIDLAADDFFKRIQSKDKS